MESKTQSRIDQLLRQMKQMEMYDGDVEVTVQFAECGHQSKIRQADAEDRIALRKPVTCHACDMASPIRITAEATVEEHRMVAAKKEREEERRIEAARLEEEAEQARLETEARMQRLAGRHSRTHANVVFVGGKEIAQ